MLPRALSLSACLVTLLGWTLAAAQPESGALQAKVKQLIEQLGAEDAAAQVAAEKALLQLGPDILAYLPGSAEGARAERLATVRSTLKEFLPRTFTPTTGTLPVSVALKQLQAQTGLPVEPFPAVKGEPVVTFTGKEIPFWKALDQIAGAAGARVALYQGSGHPALTGAGAQREALPVSHAGAFRTTVKRVTVSRDLETGLHTCQVKLDLAWEPRFHPLFVAPGTAAVRFAADREGKEARAETPTQGRTAVEAPLAFETTLRVPAPPRSVQAIAEIRGHFVVVVPSKLLTFTFTGLPKTKPQIQDGVGVRVTDVEQAADRWSFEIALDAPPGGPSFESHEKALVERSLVHNDVWLQRGKQRLRLAALDAEPIPEKSTATRTVVRYSFTAEGNPGVAFGNLADWTLHYRTSGRMVELTVPYRFTDVPLP